MKPLRVPTLPNSPLTSAASEPAYGNLLLRLNRPLSFVENAEFDDRLAVYDDNYQNSQAHSPAFQQHMKTVLGLLKRHFPANSKLVEVGCGKGDFLSLVESDGHFDATGYDATYEGDSKRIQKRYLDRSERITADVVVLRHVLEHIHAPHRFLSMIRDIFSTGHVFIEVPSYDWIIDNQAFFDITYEHVNYFSQQSLLKLFRSPPLDSGLLFDGQYQYVIAGLEDLSGDFARHYEGGDWETLDFYEVFPSLSKKMGDIEQRLKGGRVAYLWGAATKGGMFLVHCANQGRIINKVAFAVDVNPNKCGKFLPGSKVQIQDKATFFRCATNADLLIIANPNYRSEIVEELRRNGLSDIEVVCL